MSTVLHDIEAENERDAELVALHLAGDEHAFGELYGRHHSRLLSFCRQRVRDPHVAEEVTQEAFLRGLSALERLEDPQRFYPWLTVIAARIVIDFGRRSGKTIALEDIEPGTSPAAEDLWFEQLTTEELRTTLGRVKPRHRDVLRMSVYEDLSYDNIAERIGTPATTIPPLMHRARAALRREYEVVTSAQRTLALLPVLGTLTAAVRRVRDRFLTTLSNLPDINGLSAPAVGLVVGVGTLISPAAEAPSRPAPMPVATWQQIAPGTLADLIHPYTRITLVDAPEAVDPAGPSAKESQDPPRPEYVVPRVAEVNVDNEERMRWRREEARDWLVYVEAGEDTWIGIDPGEPPSELDGLSP